jgi:histidyl-tRNA synthetase
VSDRPAPPRAPRGTHDVLFPESARWEALVARFAQVVEPAGYGLAQTPTFEDAAVFRRGIGADSEVVGKEMYEFADRDGTMLALRPEGTAPVVRAYIQHRPALPFKAWYAAPAFRHERPQAGRFRQHHQLGIEALGPADADLDVEIIWLAAKYLASLGLARIKLSINSIGDENCRPAYLELLVAALSARRDELCDEHRGKIEANPLRIFDCKRPECQAVSAAMPHIADHLCDDCAAHFARVREGLEALGVDYERNDLLVRGLDYYTRTTFEFAAEALESAQNVVLGGGRYDGLVAAMGGPSTPGIGFGSGIERVLLACDAEGVFPVAPRPLDAFVVDVAGGESARQLTAALRLAGLAADRAFDGRSMKAQVKAADHSGATVALIVGADERAAGTVQVKPLRSVGEQRSVPQADAVAAVRRAVAEARETGVSEPAEVTLGTVATKQASR